MSGRWSVADGSVRSRAVGVAAAALLVAGAGVAGVVGHRGARTQHPATAALRTPSAVRATPPTAPRTTPATVPVRSQPARDPRALRPLVWVPCGAAQCATLLVPLDWSGHDPASVHRSIGVAVLRYPATGGSAARIGSLVVNPGGPGGSGVDFVRDGIASIPAAVRARFDVVGFDPRGVARSAGVRCSTGGQLDALVHLPPTPDSPAQTAELAAAAAAEAQRCATALGDELRHVDTVSVAQDVEALRAALGDGQLTYLGYSYGTAIGATYADLFPRHIRAMVLDGALDPTIDGVGFLRGQAGGFETAFDAFARWCAQAAACRFGADAAPRTADGVRAAYVALAAQVRRSPLAVGARSVGSGEFTSGTLITLYSARTGWPALGVALDRAARGDGSGLLYLSDAFVERDARGQYSTLTEANTAVNCVDRPWPRSTAAYAALADALRGPDPVFGPVIAWSGLVCAPWPVPVTGRPHPVHAPGAPPILVVGTTRDPATPYAEAVALAGQLDGGVLLTYDGDGHTVYRAGGPGCVVAVVDTYLLGGGAPPRSTGARC